MSSVQEGGNSFFRIAGDVSLTEDFSAHLDEGRSFYLFLRAYVRRSPADRQGFRFSARSDVIPEGQIDFIDYYSSAYFAADFKVSSMWTGIRLPLDRFAGDEGSLADAAPARESYAIIISAEIPPETLRNSLESGNFSFNLDLDDMGFF
jgi:hypothetical protein